MIQRIQIYWIVIAKSRVAGDTRAYPGNDENIEDLLREDLLVPGEYAFHNLLVIDLAYSPSLFFRSGRCCHDVLRRVICAWCCEQTSNSPQFSHIVVRK